MPSVSVVIPAYNCGPYLPAAIESVLEQTYSDLEIIVVDDGSTDDTPEVVRPYLDRIKYVRQSNKGLPGARNSGIRAATGSFIALLDADDAWVLDKLEKQMPLFDDPQVGIVYSDFSVKYADGRFLPSYLHDRPLASEGYVVENYIRSRFLFPSAMVLRRTALDECGLFDEEMVAAEDIELFTRLCLRWKVRRVPEALMIRFEGSHNITSNNKKMSDYTILAFAKILATEKQMSPQVRRTIEEEIARQHWWRGYAHFKTGSLAGARSDLALAIRYDKRTLRTCLPLWLATFLPSGLLKRISPSSSPREV